MVFSAWRYHSKYLKSIRFDNYIVGLRFEEIDYLRAKRKETTILPLRALMKYDFIELFDMRQTQREIRATKRALVIFFISLAPIAFAVLFDQMMISIGYLVQKHAGVKFNLTPNFDMKLNVEGEYCRNDSRTCNQPKILKFFRRRISIINLSVYI
jgi:hypothetical protein